MTTDAKPEPADKPDAKPRAKRRWYQFSLWSMLVWVTVIGVGLAVGFRWILPAQQQRSTVKMVESLRGYVYYANHPSDENWLMIQLRGWLSQDYFDSVLAIDLTGSLVTDAHLAQLHRLGQMRVLILNSTAISDLGVSHLRSSTQLQAIYLDRTQVTDGGLMQLSGLKELTFLSLDQTRITDDGLKHLQVLTKLEELHLAGTSVTDAGVKELLDALPKQPLDPTVPVCLIYR